MDYMLRATAANDQILAFACTTKETVEEARRRHDTSPVVTAALGRSLTAAAMMGWQMKGQRDQLTLRIEGSGPIQMVNVDANNRGEVWGYAKNPHVELPLNSKGKLDVAGAVGIGVMSIIKDLGLREPYCGQIHLISSEIAEDLAYYFTASEQVPSAVALGVLVDRDYTVKSAGGFIFQMMPDATDETAARLQDKVTAFPSVTDYYSRGNSPEDLLRDLLGDMDLRIHDKQPVQFYCNCNRDKVVRALISIGESDLLDLADDGESVELRCDACNEPYSFTAQEIRELAKVAAQSARNKEGKE